MADSLLQNVHRDDGQHPNYANHMFSPLSVYQMQHASQFPAPRGHAIDPATSRAQQFMAAQNSLRRARDIADSREQEKEQSQQDRQDTAAARATAKVLKEVEAQLQREARITARAERQRETAAKKAAHKEAREAKRARLEAEKTNKPPVRPRGKSREHLEAINKKTAKVSSAEPQGVVEQMRTTRGRIVKPTARARGSNLCRS
ncbi:hypothetical protein LTR56_027193 [Elasticomyces elasticus]|nr:hypothetical protein LTR56_027193 [Elasticomyces elasticus]KAK3615856.1 hypothetical protein LTR22_027268 [Elasticomyces elasticus]KAK4899046.1 hypothetical protein LTR49_027716 [Elasticomyces elasticus]